MFVAVADRTMAHAQPVHYDPGVEGRPLRRRWHITHVSMRWQQAQERREAAKRAFRERLAARAAITVKRSLATPEGIIASVAAWHGLTAADILGKSRSRPIIAARFDAIAAVYGIIACNGRKLTLADLGRIFARDHTSALNALRQRGFDRDRLTNGIAYPVARPESEIEQDAELPL